MHLCPIFYPYGYHHSFVEVSSSPNLTNNCENELFAFGLDHDCVSYEQKRPTRTCDMNKPSLILQSRDSSFFHFQISDLNYAVFLVLVLGLFFESADARPRVRGQRSQSDKKPYNFGFRTPSQHRTEKKRKSSYQF